MPSTYVDRVAAVTPSLGQFYYGSIGTVAGGATIGLELGLNSLNTAASAILDARRSAVDGLRSNAIWAASSIRDATAIAAIHAYAHSPSVSPPAIHVYRAQIVPFHIGPLALIDQLQDRLAAASDAPLEPIIREYWAPTGTWHLQEILTISMRILEEVPATTERDLYMRRWVQYDQDRERAQSL